MNYDPVHDVIYLPVHISNKKNVYKKWNLQCEYLTCEKSSDVSFMIIRKGLSTAISSWRFGLLSGTLH